MQIMLNETENYTSSPGYKSCVFRFIFFLVDTEFKHYTYSKPRQYEHAIVI